MYFNLISSNSLVTSRTELLMGFADGLVGKCLGSEKSQQQRSQHFVEHVLWAGHYLLLVLSHSTYVPKSRCCNDRISSLQRRKLRH